MRIRFTPFAKTQFLQAIAYIHRDNPSAAQSFSYSGGRDTWSTDRLPGFRPQNTGISISAVRRPYRFFYRAKGKTIWVVGVWHGAQLPDDPDKK